MHISELDTPALLIDLDIMERNLCRTAEYARAHGLRLRPHTKTHKTPELGALQLSHGAAGLTVAKVGEAEVMLESGTRDLLIAYPVLGARKLDRLMQIARRTRVTVALDSAEAARQLSQAADAADLEVGVLVETDVGLGRAGVAPGPALLDLARTVQRLPHVQFQGIAFYPGHIRSLDETGLRAIRELSGLVEGILEDFRRAGIEVEIVSGGSTPALFHSHQVAGMTEIRPGTYIFYDRNTVASGACTVADCAASILVTVVSDARPGQVLIDGGSKTFSSDRYASAPEASFGHVVEAPQAVFLRMNEEHGYVDVRAVEERFHVGDRLRVIPNHVCAAVNLHERIYGVRGDTVDQVWEVKGRGKLQ